MHRKIASQDIPLPVTYTPTTNRISKARKGKRVHACEYPGCNKVFTRAEHRRRHELSHNPEFSFCCALPGCKRKFQRADLLTRHMERHEIEIQLENARLENTRFENSPPHWKPFTPLYFPEPAQLLPSPSTMYQPPQSPRMSIQSILTPSTHLSLSAPIQQYPQPIIWDGLGTDTPPYDSSPQPPSAFQKNNIESKSIEQPNPFHTYPESCGSPSSHGTTTFSSASRPSSVSSTPTAPPLPWVEVDVDVEAYQGENILDCGLTASPVDMHAELPELLGWDQHQQEPPVVVDTMPPGHNGGEPFPPQEFIKPSAVHCQYLSPTSWEMPYEDQELFQATMKPSEL